MEDILKAADWSSQGVFQKFHYKQKGLLAFGLTVLVDTVTFTGNMLIGKPSLPKYNIQIMQWLLYEEGDVEISTCSLLFMSYIYLPYYGFLVSFQGNLATMQ